MNATRAAYDRWASTYPPMPHNPLMQGEQAAMLELWPDMARLRVLDLACGTGRYARLLAKRNAGEVIAVDFSAAMLQQVSVDRRVLADMTQLPFVDGAFDAVVCGLALGHAPAIGPWMAEGARVLTRGGYLLYSDFHPEAARAGLVRSFKDEHDRRHMLSHHDHSLGIQRQAAAAANLALEVVRELRVGIEFREPFPDSDTFYERHRGLPLLLVVRARKY
jgi:ubiquinone/menaquinone biosynthesis C-methylase UbiE